MKAFLILLTVHAGFLGLFHWWFSRMPKATPPAAGQEFVMPSSGQKFRYYLAMGTALFVGASIGCLFLFVLSPYGIADAEMQLALASEGDAITSLFLGLSTAAFVGPIVLRCFVEDSTFVYFMFQQGKRYHGADMSVLSNRVGSVFIVLSLVFHAFVSNTYVAADEQRLWWSDFFEIRANKAPWTGVKELLVVELLRTPVGTEKERLHLVWVLNDGRRVRMADGNGRFEGLRPEEIDRAVQFTRERGLPVRRVRRDG